MDYLLFDAPTSALWVPAGNSGSVDVIHMPEGSLTRIDGFPTAEIERDGRKRTVGPSSVTRGDDAMYVGNRGDATICRIDPIALKREACGPKLDSLPDGIAYVASTKELWVTTPRDHSIRILDAVSLKQKQKLAFDGAPEGYAIDARRGRFYTNLEDKDRTLAIDLLSHATVATWKPGCGPEGPHGLRLSESDGMLLIACSARVETMDVAHDGAILSTLDTGDGVDNIDFSVSTRNVYAAAGKAAELLVAHVDELGRLKLVAKVTTKPGARNAIVDAQGNVYLAHSKGAEVLVVSPIAR